MPLAGFVTAMRLFLTTFFIIYGSFYLYFFLKFRLAFASLATGWYVFLGLFLALMFLGPVLIHVVEALRQDWIAATFARIVYIWMGFLFLFLCLSLLGDFYGGTAHLLHLVTHEKWTVPVPGIRTSFLTFAGVAAMIGIYGIHEAGQIRIERLIIPTEKLSPERDRFRIVQISDLHLGITTRPEQVRRIVAAISEAEPDLLVCTGDLMDGQPDSFAPNLEPFQRIAPPYGKFAVMGNHEFYVGLERSVKWITWAGFRVLRDETADVAKMIRLIGIDDHEAFRHSDKFTERIKVFDAVRRDDNRFTIFLKHRPLFVPKIAKIADLQLSGHTHRGQIFPFGLFTRLAFPYHSGLYTFKNGFQLYVSRGTGTWGPPMRFLSPPEITVIDLFPLKDTTGARGLNVSTS